jgi:MFS family permease
MNVEPILPFWTGVEMTSSTEEPAFDTQNRRESPQRPRRLPPWLNRNVFGMGLTSLLSDAGHEMATAILPGFFAVLGLPAAALGAIEGIADAVSSFVKLGAGWYSDQTGSRKTITVLGYVLTGAAKALFAIAYGWPLLLVGRVVAWFGRGIRGPLRDAMLAESVPLEARGRAFGFHRAGDTLGAIIGPLIAIGLLRLLSRRASDASMPFRVIFLVTLIPGLASAIAFGVMVHETRRKGLRGSLWDSIGKLPRSFWRFLIGVGLFGAGDYSHTLMILAAAQLLAPSRGVIPAAEIAALLYVIHNVLYAVVSYPVGALSDRWGRRALLTCGYALGAIVAAGFAAAFWSHTTQISRIAVLFALGGTFIAIQDAMEGAMTADLAPHKERHGVAYGLTGTVNGVGDFLSSTIVGGIWTLHSPVAAFLYAAVIMSLGAVAIYRVR